MKWRKMVQTIGWNPKWWLKLDKLLRPEDLLSAADKKVIVYNKNKFDTEKKLMPKFNNFFLGNLKQIEGD